MKNNLTKYLTFPKIGVALAIGLILCCIYQTRQGLKHAIVRELTEIALSKPDKDSPYIELDSVSVTYSSHTQLLPYHPSDSDFIAIRNTVWCKKSTGNRVYFTPISSDYNIYNQLLKPTSYLASNALVKLNPAPNFIPVEVENTTLYILPQPKFSPFLFFAIFAVFFGLALYGVLREDKRLLSQLGVFSVLLYLVCCWFPISLESIPLFSAELYSAGSLIPNFPTLLSVILMFTVAFGWVQLTVHKFKAYLLVFLWLLAYACITWSMASLVQHSTIVFSFADIFSTAPSNLAALFFLVYVGVLILISVRALLYTPVATRIVIVAYVLFNALAYLYNYVDLLEINWHFGLMVLTLIYHKKSNQPYFAGLLIAACCLSFVYEKHMGYKAESRARLIADDLMHNDDPVAKYFFKEKLTNLKQGMSLIDLRASVLQGYLGQFNLSTERTSNTIDSCDFNGSTIYLLQPAKSSKGFLPDILIDRAISSIATKGYDWRVFHENKLLFESAFALGHNSNRKSISFEQSNYTATIFFPNKPTFHFAGLSALMLLLLCLPTVMVYMISYAFNFQSIRNKIVTGSLLSIVLVTAIITYFSFQSVEKMMTTDLYQSIADKIKYSSKLLDGYSTQEIIKAVSESNELNLYALNGNLVATGQSEVFEQDLLPYEVSSKVGYQVKHSPSGVVVLLEKIGNLQYYSAFQYVNNNEGEVAGMLNLTYLGLQNIHNLRLEELLTNILMVAILFTMLWFVVAILYYRNATKPLSILEKSIGELKLESQNKPIQYKGRDEIGQLVNVYNKKVIELQELIARLAQSEREKAWREMAKQVAHEIKNPLTPMKLNAQLYLRKIEKTPEDAVEKTKVFCDGLIQQIDTLTNIANAFAQYAHVAQSKPSSLNLASEVQKCIDFYAESSTTNFSLVGSGSVWFDQDQLTRVLNNLVTNAQQAFSTNSENRIRFTIISDEETTTLTVADNGPGIPEEIQSKIFHPYFTTKGTGTGIGLAMVKQMVEHQKGSINFTSSSEGSTFTVRFLSKQPGQ